MSVEIGKRYECLNRTYDLDLKSKSRGFFTIVLREGGSMNSVDCFNFLGIHDAGFHVMFNYRGSDKWQEFGGAWFELNLKTECDPTWRLDKL